MLATKENLFARKCARDPVCGICGVEVESIEHVLFRCEWTQKVWENCGASFQEPVNSVVSTKRWINDIFSEFGSLFSKKLGTISQICWGIQKQVCPKPGESASTRPWGPWRIPRSGLFAGECSASLDV